MTNYKIDKEKQRIKIFHKDSNLKETVRNIIRKEVDFVIKAIIIYDSSNCIKLYMKHDVLLFMNNIKNEINTLSDTIKKIQKKN